LSLRERLRLFAETASAIGGLHRTGIIHTALHPDRIGVRANGEAVLLDLGMSWVAGTLRGGGDVLDYCAPECFSNRVPDVRADIYSLGLLLHYLLTGEKPSRSRSGQLARLSALPEELTDLQPLLALMLVEQPAQRPSVTMLLDQLNALVMRSPRLATRIEADRNIGEAPFERLLTPLSALSQRPALTGTGAPMKGVDASRWDAPAGTGRWNALLMSVGLILVCGSAWLIWSQTRPEPEVGLIQKLVQHADAQFKEGKLLLPADDNALDTLRTLRIAAPGNPELAAISARIEEGAAEVVQEVLRQGQLDEADLALSRAIRAFPDNHKLAALSGSLAQARREAEEREQLSRLFASIDNRLAGTPKAPGQIDAAIVLLRQAQDVAEDDIGIAERRLRLESILAEQVKAELESGHLQLAKENLDRLREIAHTSSSLANLEEDYRRLLGVESHRQQLAQLLKEASAAEEAGIEQTAALNRALKAYLQVLRLDPSDTHARRRATALGHMALTRARQAVERQEWTSARAYLALGHSALPRNAELSELDARVAQGADEQSAAVRKLLDGADLALRRGNYFSPQASSAWALYQRALAYPQAQNIVPQGLKKLRAAVLKDVDSLMAQRRYDAAGVLLEKAREHIANDAELGRRKLTLNSIIEQRSSSKALANGFIAINAVPWAYIHSVRKADGQHIQLEAEATTPLRLSVPAGEYLIELRPPNNGQSREVRAKVQSGQGTSVSVNLRGEQ
jgi:tetratricopeptide (TPR) repeat protein